MSNLMYKRRETGELNHPEKVSGEIQRPALAALTTIGIFLAIGTVYYHVAEGWSYIDSLYFCVFSLTTVGYGDPAPTTAATRLFTVFYLLIGTGVVVASLGVIGSRYLERRDRRLAAFRAAREKRETPSAPGSG